VNAAELTVADALRAAGFTVAQVMPVTGGWGGANYRAETSAGTLVVKVRGDRRSLGAGKAATAVLQLRGIPHPRVVIAPTATPAGWLMAQQWIDGSSLDTVDAASWTDPDAAHFGADLGDWLRLLHGVQVAGRVWLPAARQRYRAKAERCVGLGLIDAALAAATDHRWAGVEDALANVRPALIHRDLQPGNIVVRDGRFASVIDFEQARIADPYYDFVKLREWVLPLHPGIGPALYTAYGLNPDAPRTAARLTAVHLLEYLSALVYYSKQGDVVMLDDQRQRLRQLVHA
jgi:aminoglycoside phosphotransferase (APT) family kinase protein